LVEGLRICRGGDWRNGVEHARASSRSALDAAAPWNGVGLRLALPIAQVKNAIALQSNSASSWHGWPADAPPPAIAPFDAAQAKQHQEAWAKYLGVPVEYTNSIGMKFILVPPGEFVMGSTAEELRVALQVTGTIQHWRECFESEAPQHRVILTKPIFLGVFEATQGQYETLMGSNPSHFTATGKGKDSVAEMNTANFPVEMMNWTDAAEFCALLQQR
jgi:formylglycine-generating enzyme required for sulfatase activity